MTGTTNFLFINRTGKSSKLTKLGKAEASQIQHHVQSGRRRPRRSKNRPGVDKISSAYNVTSASYDEIGHIRPTSSVYSSQTSEVALRDSNAMPPVYLTLNTIIPGSTDPFSVSVIPLDETVQNLLQYYTAIYHPSCWPNEQAALKRGGYIFEDAVNTTVRNSMHDEMLLYSVLVAAITRMRYIDALPIKYAIYADQYMHKALQQIQRRISQHYISKSDRSSLMSAMMFLSSAEAYRSNSDTSNNHLLAAKIHLEGALKLLDYFGMDISEVEDPNLQGQMIMSDLFLACVNMERCLIDAGLFDPGPVHVLNLTNNELLRTNNWTDYVASALIANSCLSKEVSKAVEDIKEMYVTKMRLNTAEMQSNRALETTHWVGMRAMAIRNRLMSIFPVEFFSPMRYDDLNDLLNLATRSALIQFTLISMNITGRVKTVKIMARHLWQLLKPLVAADFELNSDQSKLLFWILATGLTCAEAKTSTEMWFSRNLVRIHERYGSLPGFFGPPQHGSPEDNIHQQADVQEMVDLLGKHFYHPYVQAVRLSALFNNDR